MPCWIIPQVSTAFGGATPIFPTVTGGGPQYWNGPPVRWRVAIDQDSQGNDIRVVLTNQEDAILAYVKRVTDPNVMDSTFQYGWTNLLAARVAYAITRDKALANGKLVEANQAIQAARANDGNEGLTINDVTPDWIRTRGICYPTEEGFSPNMMFDWGPLLSLYT